MTESTGEISSGITERRASRTNKSGRAIDRSAAARINLSLHPPTSPAKPPKTPAINVDIKAAAGASSRDTRVP